MYLAGGAVRDLLLGTPFSDRDYLVVGTTQEEFAETFPAAREVGRTFPIFLLEKLEFSFPRKSSLDEELKARDLTVNALLLDEHGELICHPQTLEDLHTRTLRPASNQSFIDDPLRVFRAARFWAKFPDFTPHPELISTMRATSADNLLHSLPPDRIGQETMKALAAERPGNYLRLLEKGNCLEPWLQILKQSLNIPAGPPEYHSNSVFGHTCHIMDKLAGNAATVWMGLCHDLGKVLTPSERLPSHNGHDKAGIGLAEELSTSLRLSNAMRTAGAKAAKWHMIAARYPELRPGTKVDLLMDLHLSRTLSGMFALVFADHDTDHFQQAREDLKLILEVSLPPEHMNLGEESGKRLRELRAAKLATASKK